MTVVTSRPIPADSAPVVGATVDSGTGSQIATATRPQTRSPEPRPAPRPDYSIEGHPRRWMVLPVILTAMFMAMFDSSVGFSTSY